MAINKNGTDKIATTILTQMDTHAGLGGGVTEIASRMQRENKTMVIKEILKEIN